LIDRLAGRGYVEKAPDPKDARGTLIRLTDEGFALFRRVAVEHMASITARVGGALDTDDLAQLAVLCDKLRADEG
jgi:DNA-binding MarR family transcriptional regulator